MSLDVVSKNEFLKGFCCAVSTLLSISKDSRLAEHLYQENFHTLAQLKRAGVDSMDIKAITPLIREINRKTKLK